MLICCSKIKNLYLESLETNGPECENTGVDDLDLSRCLQKLNAPIADSRDELKRERFHPSHFEREFYGPIDNSEYPFHKQSAGKQCCSKSWISFHDKNHLNFNDMIHKIDSKLKTE